MYSQRLFTAAGIAASLFGQSNGKPCKQLPHSSSASLPTIVNSTSFVSSYSAHVVPSSFSLSLPSISVTPNVSSFSTAIETTSSSSVESTSTSSFEISSTVTPEPISTITIEPTLTLSDEPTSTSSLESSSSSSAEVTSSPVESTSSSSIESTPTSSSIETTSTSSVESISSSTTESASTSSADVTSSTAETLSTSSAESTSTSSAETSSSSTTESASTSSIETTSTSIEPTSSAIEPTSTSSSEITSSATPETTSTTSDIPTTTEVTSSSTTSDVATSTSSLAPIVTSYSLVSANSGNSAANGQTLKYRDTTTGGYILYLTTTSTYWTEGTFTLEDGTNYLKVGDLYVATTSTNALYAVASSLISSATTHITCTSPVRQGAALSCQAADGVRTQIAVRLVNAGSYINLYIVAPSVIGSTYGAIDLIAS